jgi:hypothetical protein
MSEASYSVMRSVSFVLNSLSSPLETRIESAVRLDIDSMMHRGAIQPGFHVGGEMRLHQFYGDDIDAKFESHAGDPWNSWLCLRYSMTDYCSGEELKIDDKIYLASTRPHFGGLRWWFVCPHLNRRVRKLYLPLGGRHFWSRRAYELAYASQRETKFDRALRRARKLRVIGRVATKPQARIRGGLSGYSAGRSGAGTTYTPGRNATWVTNPGPGARVTVCSRSHSASASSARRRATVGVDALDVGGRHGLPEDHVEWTLDVDRRAENPTQARRERGEEPKLRECPSCKTVMAAPPCHACGWMPAPRRGQDRDFADGELGLVVGGKAQAPVYDENTRVEFFQQLRAVQQMRDYKRGWAAHKFKDKFGHFPPWSYNDLPPIAPTDAVLSWVRSRNIAYAKRRAGRMNEYPSFSCAA